MTDQLPLTHFYNLARLGNAGDEVFVCADETQCEQIARWSNVLSIESFKAEIEIKKTGATHFVLNFRADIRVTQACVVTLEPVNAHLERKFSRELHYAALGRRSSEAAENGDISGAEIAEEEGPEEIASLQYDLAAPVLEEYVLALEPYPRSPGVEFSPRIEAGGPAEGPFSALKGLKLGS